MGPDEYNAFKAGFDSVRIVRTIMGREIEPPATGAELTMATTANVYANRFGVSAVQVGVVLGKLGRSLRSQ